MGGRNCGRKSTPLSKYWGNFLVGIYIRNVLRTEKQSILVSWREWAFQHRHGFGERMEQEWSVKR